jgi:putative SOS response-associated peptidase YedK
MCTNFLLIRQDGTADLARRLQVDAEQFLYSDNQKPGSRISIVTGPTGGRRVQAALWWLYLQQTETGLKPHPDYFSVNTNHAKLASKREYRHNRCIVPASAFVESQDGKAPHLLEPADGSALAFGGLYKNWIDKVTGEEVFSASIITLPGHPALEQIHRKSTPLWLPEEAFDAWLAPELTDPKALEHLLQPALRAPLRATPVDKVGTKRPIGPAFVISHLET